MLRRSVDSKDCLKRTLKYVLRCVGAVLPRQHDVARILTYHSVGFRDHDMNVLPVEFRKQMEWLADNAKVIPLREAAKGKPGVALTFDDGYRDNLTEAAPILQEFGFPATVYVVPERVGGHLAHDPPSEATALLTWDEIRTLESMGIEIGAHTLNHRRLSALPINEQEFEIIGSVHMLEKTLGHPIESFAYPFGSSADFTSDSVAIAAQSGVRFAVSNCYGFVPPGADLLRLRRIWIDHTDSVATFAAKVNGRLDLLVFQDSPAGLKVRKWINKLLRRA